MGLKSSKNSRLNSETHLPPNRTQKYDDEVVNRLRRDLKEDPEIFLLNNILLSIQFYENFDKEMENLRKNQVSKREIELNKALTGYQKHCLLPDTVMEIINERVRFRPYHGPKKFESQPLLPQRMFIVYDNIEVLYEGETSEYSTVDGPIHKAIIEQAKKQGYVQLRQKELLDIQNQNNVEESDSESNPTSPNPVTPITPPVMPSNVKERLFLRKPLPDSPTVMPNTQFTFAQTDNILNEPRRPSDAKRSSLKNKILRSQSFSLISPRNSIRNQQHAKSVENLTKENKSEPEEYGYSNLRRLTTPKPLNEIRAHSNISDANALLSHCVTEIKVEKLLDEDEDYESDDSLMENGTRRPPIKKKKQDFFEIKRYFNSEKFFKHFGDVFDTIYPTLGFSRDSYKNTMAQGGIIYCESFDKNNNKISYEIIPTVATSWPEVAYEWNIRNRAKIFDPNTQIMYEWPTEKMRKKIQSLQSNILPMGFLAKRGINENNSLEWTLSFPAAERFMETCMSHSQIRCYLFIMALYKTYMEPPNTKIGLAPHHIMTLIFWQCERNFVTWPEERLGVKMLRILKVLYDRLAIGHLPDFFVRDRNLLESAPSKYLRFSQAKLHDIIERPVMHVIIAMRNLRYTNGTFFPTLDFKKLYRIISTNDSFSLINPSLSIMTQNNVEFEQEDVNENEISMWEKARKTEDRKREWKRALRKQLDIEKKEEQENLKKIRRGSVDSINIELTVSKMDMYKTRVLLEFFIIHFLAVANKCYEYQSYNYALVILNHTHNLAILLGEEPSGQVEAQIHKKKIGEQIEKCRRAIIEKRPRVLSNRDSQNFSSTFSMVKNHNLNWNNLQNSFDNNVVNAPPEDVLQLRRKNKPQNLQISADVHATDSLTPTSKKNTPTSSSRTSIILDDKIYSTDL